MSIVFMRVQRRSIVDVYAVDQRDELSPARSDASNSVRGRFPAAVPRESTQRGKAQHVTTLLQSRRGRNF